MKELTPNQKKAITAMESALKGLKRNKIKIHLMDCALLYATESAIDDYSDLLKGDYPAVAELTQEKDHSNSDEIMSDNRIGSFVMPKDFQLDGGAW